MFDGRQFHAFINDRCRRLRFSHLQGIFFHQSQPVFITQNAVNGVEQAFPVQLFFRNNHRCASVRHGQSIFQLVIIGRPRIRNQNSSLARNRYFRQRRRAGATSLAEITVAGKAAVLIPYPWAANDHQLKNALAMSDAGAAMVIPEKELNGESLFNAIDGILRDENRLRLMEENSLKMGKAEAAATIVDECMKLAAVKH